MAAARDAGGENYGPKEEKQEEEDDEEEEEKEEENFEEKDKMAVAAMEIARPSIASEEP